MLIVPEKLLYVCNLVINTTFNKKMDEAESKLSDFSGLVTNTALNTNMDEVQNKIPDQVLYITTPEFSGKCCDLNVVS